jgi:hypothetical protein
MLSERGREPSAMPQFAQSAYIKGTDTAFKATGNLFVFDLPDLMPAREVTLMFKVSGKSGSQVKMSLVGPVNSIQVNFPLDSTFTEPRSWHEVNSTPNAFRELGNRLIIEGGANISDIVIIYHAETP